MPRPHGGRARGHRDATRDGHGSDGADYSVAIDSLGGTGSGPSSSGTGIAKPAAPATFALIIRSLPPRMRRRSESSEVIGAGPETTPGARPRILFLT